MNFPLLFDFMNNKESATSIPEGDPISKESVLADTNGLETREILPVSRTQEKENTIAIKGRINRRNNSILILRLVLIYCHFSIDNHSTYNKTTIVKVWKSEMINKKTALFFTCHN